MRRALIALCYIVATMCLATLTLVGYALARLYRREVPSTTKGNCWSFAVPRWLRDPVATYLVVSLSRHAPVPHVRFAPSIEGLYVEELVPKNPRKGWRGVLDSVWFDGEVRRNING